MSRSLLFIVLSLVVACCAGCSPPSARAPSQGDDAANDATDRVAQSAAIESKESDDAAREGPVQLAIVSPKIDGDKITLTLQVTNQGSEPIIWDREFSIFLIWKVRADDTDLTDEPVAEVKRVRESISERFVTIAPGEFMKKDFEITKSMKTFWHMRGSFATPDGGSHEVPVANEHYSRFVFPRGTRMIHISAGYEGADSNAQDGFAVCFGRRPHELGIVEGKCTSNEVAIRLK